MATATDPRSPAYSEAEKSRVILLGTAVAFFAVMTVWLVLSALSSARGGAGFVVVDLPGPEWPAATSEELVDLLKRELRGVGDAPAVVVLRGVAASRWAESGKVEHGPFLLGPPRTAGGTPVARKLAPALDWLNDRGGRSPTLLVVDAEVRPGDLALGLYGNDFVRDLKERAKESPNVAILLPCSEGQASWPLDGRGGTAFGLAVSQALDDFRSTTGGRFNAGALLDQVAPAVASWAGGRNARQVPLLLGNRDLAFRVGGRPSVKPPVAVAAKAPAADAPAPDGPFKAIDDEWVERARAAGASPPPRRAWGDRWSAYNRRLLDAERLLRQGHRDEASAALGEARNLRAAAAGLSSDQGTAGLHSIALLRGAGGEAALRADEYEEAIKSLLERFAGSPAPPPAVRPAQPEPAADKAEKPPEGEAEAPSEVPAPPPPVAIADPLATLTASGDRSRPRAKVVEANPVVWYAEFVRRGGETDRLRARRLPLLRRVVDARIAAEKVATLEPRALVWAMTDLEEGDGHRRAAEDALFAGLDAELDRAEDAIRSAEAAYRRATDRGVSASEAVDALDEARELLPALGDWSARPPELLDRHFEPAAIQAGELAALLDQPTAKPDDLRDAARQLTAALAGARNDANLKAAAPSRHSSWRGVDALLRLPWIDPDRREGLRDRAAELSPVPELGRAVSAAELGDQADPRFVSTAVNLCNVKVGLLRAEGRGDSRMKVALNGGPYEVDKFSDALDALRDAPPEPSEAGGASAGWLAERLGEEGGPAVVERGTLSADFAEGDGASAVELSAKGPFPEGGRAVVFLGIDEGATAAATPKGKSLVTIAPGAPASVEFDVINRGAGAAFFTPVAYFRGRFHDSRAVPLAPTREVTIEIVGETSREYARARGDNRRGLVDVPIADQFAKRQDRGYFHRNKPLKYWLRLTNHTGRTLDLTVKQSLDGEKTDRLQIEPRGQDETTEGELVAGPGDRKLHVTVHEGGENGRQLCAPLDVDFIPVDPTTFVIKSFAFNGAGTRPLVTYELRHDPADPAPFPVEAIVEVEPPGAVREVTSHRQFPFDIERAVPRGATIFRKYYLLDPATKSLTFILKVNGEPAIRETRQMKEGAPEAPPVPPEGPLAPPPAAPFGGR